MKKIAILAGAALLSACGHSPPTQFFVLDAAPPSHAAPRTTIAPVQLDAVHIPDILDRPEVVTQTAPNRLGVSDQDQWGAPFGDMMRRVLAEDLLTRLPVGSFVPPDAPKPAGVRGLVVDVLQLQAAKNGKVKLEASWSLMATPSERTLVRRDVRLTADNRSGAAAGQAAAISDLLGQLADRIAAELAA